MVRSKNVYLAVFILIYFTIGFFSFGIENKVNSESVTIDQILENYKTKCCGEALGGISSEIITGLLTRGEAGSVPFEAKLKAPGRILYNQVFAFGDQVSYGFDGHGAWLQSTDSVSAMPESILLDLQMIFDTGAPLKIREYFPEMKLKGIKKQSEGDIALIDAVSKNGLQRELVFDLKTGLLLKAGDIYFYDYRQTGKIMRPYRIFIGDDLGEDVLRIKMEFTNIQENIDINDALFLKPAVPLRNSSFSILKDKKEIPLSLSVLENLTGTYRRIDKPEITYTIYLQDGHLMIQRFDAPISVEIRPESESDFFVRFPTTEYHFINETDKKILEIEARSQKVKAEKIK
jgi:hypothetical protein